MPTQERRQATRRQLRVPLCFRTVSSARQETFEGETLNISERGVYFATARPLKIGESLEMFLAVPEVLAQHGSEQVHCSGCVVHVRNRLPEDGRAGIGVAIQKYVSLTNSPWPAR